MKKSTSKKSHKKSHGKMRGRGIIKDTIKPFITGMFDKALDALGKTKEYAKTMGESIPADFKPSNLISKGMNVDDLKQKAWDSFKIPFGASVPILTDIKDAVQTAFSDYGFGYKRKRHSKKKSHKKKKC